MEGSKMKLHVYCLNWNGKHLIQKSIPTLKKNLYNINIPYDIWVRDNGSSDHSIKYLEKNHPDIKLKKISHNTDSFSTGINSLFIQSKPDDNDIILLLNNDIEFIDNNSIKQMLNTMTKTKAAIVGAKLLYSNGTISHNGVIFSKKYGNMPWHYREGKKPNKYDMYDREFQAVTAACCLVRAGNFRKAGMLDNNLFWSFEDISMNLEISINQKEKIVCCGKTNIIHLTSESLKKNPVNKMFLNQNVQYFKEKWFGKYDLDHEKYLKNPNYNLIR